MQLNFHIITPFHIKHLTQIEAPLDLRPCTGIGKRQNMRQLHRFTPFRLSEKAKTEAPLRPQGRVDTTPGDVHNHFR